MLLPAGLDDAQSVALILNYVTAYQMIHRSAAMRAGQTALVTGANGGVGSALLQLLRVAGVRAIAACAERHFDYVRALGAEPIPSRGAQDHTQDHTMVQAARKIVPAGVDAAFDVMGGAGTWECVRATRRGGTVVGYGFMGTTVKGKPSRRQMLRGFVALFVGARLVGRRGRFYGITALYRKDKAPFKQDLPKLFDLLASGKISPAIAHRLPLLAARKSQELLQAGGVARQDRAAARARALAVGLTAP